MLYGRVFSGREVDERPFRDDTWTMALLGGGLRLTAEDFLGIEALARVHGDHECLVLDPEWNFEDQAASVLPLRHSAWDSAAVGSPLGHVGLRIVPPSGMWAVAIDVEGVAVLAAASLDAFFAAAGGADAVLSRYAADESTVGFGPKGVAFRRRLREMVGAPAA
ncbi:MAG: hypothetical protein KF709_12910 [Gemmatimonadaceae bacterium]|nr:hypothetical protein [Gemmatimonadaceae bacterium]